MNIYVGNISYDATENDLRSAFETFGQIQSATIAKDKSTGSPKGFGFVEMLSKEEAQAAINGLNDQELKGRDLAVNETRAHTDYPQRKSAFVGVRRGGGDDRYKRRRNEPQDRSKILNQEWRERLWYL